MDEEIDNTDELIEEINTDIDYPEKHGEYLREFNFESTPIVDTVNEIILDSINRGASDIHFDPFEDGVKIRIRIDGDLHNYALVPLSMKKNLITRIKIISNLNITESRLPQDGSIKGLIDSVDVDLRVSSLPTSLGEKLVIRILDYSLSTEGLEHLGFSRENYELLNKMTKLNNGMILVTGATGSGKSTTVYAILQKLNTEERNIVTVEDPIEMNIHGINQVLVNSEIGMTFQSALRSILRQDPDVIMIGEIRDVETAKIAVRASITGHLVLSTLHTNDSLSTIERLIDMNVERYLLSSSLSGIISQKLARKLCPKCKKLRATTASEKEVFRKVLKINVNGIYEACGCDECSSGYKGRIPIHEVLYLDQSIKDDITNNISKQDLKKKVFNEHTMNSTMLEDGLKKVLQGDTSFDEIIKNLDIDDETLSFYDITTEETIKELETFHI